MLQSSRRGSNAGRTAPWRGIAQEGFEMLVTVPCPNDSICSSTSFISGSVSASRVLRARKTTTATPVAGRCCWNCKFRSPVMKTSNRSCRILSNTRATSSVAAALWAACARLQHDFDFDRQQMIDHVSAAIGIAMRWLCSAKRIGSAGDESLFPRLRRCLPVELPQSPRVRVRFAKQF